MPFGLGICGQCCGAAACGTICISVTGCNLPEAGSTVTVTGPGIITGSPCTSALGLNTVTVTNGGSGYTSAPAVSFSGGGGSGAAATTTLVTSGVLSYTVTAGGSGYTSRPAVSVTPSAGGGSGATANAFLLHTSVDSVTISNGGSGYTSAPTIAFTSGGGTGAAAAATMTAAGATSAGSGGAGYAVGDLLTVSGGTATVAAIMRVTSVTAGAVTGAAVDTAGAYTATPANPAATTGGSGSGCTLNLVYTVASAAVTAGGANYTFPPTVGFSGGGGGSAAAAIAVLTPTSVNILQVGGTGSGYVAPPTVTISGGGGSGATATGAVSATAGHVQSVTVTAQGTGYTSAPTVTIAAPSSGTTATGTAVMSARCCVTITSPGNYSITASGPSADNWFNNTLVMNTVPCAGASVTNGTVSLRCIAPTAPAGYFNYGTCGCITDACCPDSLQRSSPAWQSLSWPNTLFVNDGFGLVTLLLNSSQSLSSAHVTYFGCATRTAANGETGGDCAGSSTTATGVSVPVLFTLYCENSITHGTWTLTVVTAGGERRFTMPSVGTCDATTGSILFYCGTSVLSGGASGSAVITSCSPFAGTFPVAFGSASGPGVQQIYGTGTVNMSVSP